jgi:beta-lactamase superfamily II metal-dependent hydrolase
MTLVKSFATGAGDTYYIKHGSDNFTIIDCRIDEFRDDIIDEIREESSCKGVIRFISTHPDDDHIKGLARLDDTLGLRNFYVVKNRATKPDYTVDFERYRELHDDTDIAFYVERGCTRRWMNQRDEGRGSSGINVLWPSLSNPDFQNVLTSAEDGGSPNNLSTILKYSLSDGATMLWMGDLETDFMKTIEDEIELPEVDIVFAAHHGRARVPSRWMAQMDPKVVVLGEAPPEHLEYYSDRDHIRQNATGDITFECVEDMTHIYVESESYAADFLQNEYMHDTYGTYIGSVLCD